MTEPTSKVYFVNIYLPFAGSCGSVYETRAMADQMARGDRIACKEVYAFPGEGDRAGGKAGMTVIMLPFPPSTNGLFVNSKHGRFRSQKYDSWIMEAGNEILRQRPSKCLGPVNLRFEFQDGRDNRKRDVSNLIKAPEDLLVRHGIIEADDSSIVRSVTAKWSPDVEGVKVTIEPLFHRVPELAGTAGE